MSGVLPASPGGSSLLSPQSRRYSNPIPFESFKADGDADNGNEGGVLGTSPDADSTVISTSQTMHRQRGRDSSDGSSRVVSTRGQGSLAASGVGFQRWSPQKAARSSDPSGGGGGGATEVSGVMSGFCPTVGVCAYGFRVGMYGRCVRQRCFSAQAAPLTYSLSLFTGADLGGYGPSELELDPTRRRRLVRSAAEQTVPQQQHAR